MLFELKQNDWIDACKEIDRLNALIKKKPTTVEEMEKRWDNLAPPHARYVLFCNNNGHFQRIEITQDELQNIRDYLDAVEECLNG